MTYPSEKATQDIDRAVVLDKITPLGMFCPILPPLPPLGSRWIGFSLWVLSRQLQSGAIADLEAFGNIFQFWDFGTSGQGSDTSWLYWQLMNGDAPDASGHLADTRSEAQQPFTQKSGFPVERINHVSKESFSADLGSEWVDNRSPLTSIELNSPLFEETQEPNPSVLVSESRNARDFRSVEPSNEAIEVQAAPKAIAPSDHQKSAESSLLEQRPEATFVHESRNLDPDVNEVSTLSPKETQTQIQTPPSRTLDHDRNSSDQDLDTPTVLQASSPLEAPLWNADHQSERHLGQQTLEISASSDLLQAKPAPSESSTVEKDPIPENLAFSGQETLSSTSASKPKSQTADTLEFQTSQRQLSESSELIQPNLSDSARQQADQFLSVVNTNTQELDDNFARQPDTFDSQDSSSDETPLAHSETPGLSTAEFSDAVTPNLIEEQQPSIGDAEVPWETTSPYPADECTEPLLTFQSDTSESSDKFFAEHSEDVGLQDFQGDSAAQSERSELSPYGTEEVAVLRSPEYLPENEYSNGHEMERSISDNDLSIEAEQPEALFDEPQQPPTLHQPFPEIQAAPTAQENLKPDGTDSRAPVLNSSISKPLQPLNEFNVSEEQHSSKSFDSETVTDSLRDNDTLSNEATYLDDQSDAIENLSTLNQASSEFQATDFKAVPLLDVDPIRQSSHIPNSADFVTQDGLVRPDESANLSQPSLTQSFDAKSDPESLQVNDSPQIERKDLSSTQPVSNAVESEGGLLNWLNRGVNWVKSKFEAAETEQDSAHREDSSQTPFQAESGIDAIGESKISPKAIRKPVEEEPVDPSPSASDWESAPQSIHKTSEAVLAEDTFFTYPEERSQIFLSPPENISNRVSTEASNQPSQDSATTPSPSSDLGLQVSEAIAENSSEPLQAQSDADQRSNNDFDTPNLSSTLEPTASDLSREQRLETPSQAAPSIPAPKEIEAPGQQGRVDSDCSVPVEQSSQDALVFPEANRADAPVLNPIHPSGTAEQMDVETLSDGQDVQIGRSVSAGFVTPESAEPSITQHDEVKGIAIEALQPPQEVGLQSHAKTTINNTTSDKTRSQQLQAGLSEGLEKEGHDHIHEVPPSAQNFNEQHDLEAGEIESEHFEQSSSIEPLSDPASVERPPTSTKLGTENLISYQLQNTDDRVRMSPLQEKDNSVSQLSELTEETTPRNAGQSETISHKPDTTETGTSADEVQVQPDQEIATLNRVEKAESVLSETQTLQGQAFEEIVAADNLIVKAPDNFVQGALGDETLSLEREHSNAQEEQESAIASGPDRFLLETPTDSTLSTDVSARAGTEAETSLSADSFISSKPASSGTEEPTILQAMSDASSPIFETQEPLRSGINRGSCEPVQNSGSERKAESVIDPNEQAELLQGEVSSNNAEALPQDIRDISPNRSAVLPEAAHERGSSEPELQSLLEQRAIAASINLDPNLSSQQNETHQKVNKVSEIPEILSNPKASEFQADVPSNEHSTHNHTSAIPVEAVTSIQEEPLSPVSQGVERSPNNDDEASNVFQVEASAPVLEKEIQTPSLDGSPSDSPPLYSNVEIGKNAVEKTSVTLNERQSLSNQSEASAQTSSLDLEQSASEDASGFKFDRSEIEAQTIIQTVANAAFESGIAPLPSAEQTSQSSFSSSQPLSPNIPSVAEIAPPKTAQNESTDRRESVQISIQDQENQAESIPIEQKTVNENNAPKDVHPEVSSALSEQDEMADSYPKTLQKQSLQSGSGQGAIAFDITSSQAVQQIETHDASDDLPEASSPDLESFASAQNEIVDSSENTQREIISKLDELPNGMVSLSEPQLESQQEHGAIAADIKSDFSTQQFVNANSIADRSPEISNNDEEVDPHASLKVEEHPTNDISQIPLEAVTFIQDTSLTVDKGVEQDPTRKVSTSNASQRKQSTSSSKEQVRTTKNPSASPSDRPPFSSDVENIKMSQETEHIGVSTPDSVSETPLQLQNELTAVASDPVQTSEAQSISTVASSNTSSTDLLNSEEESPQHPSSTNAFISSNPIPKNPEEQTIIQTIPDISSSETTIKKSFNPVIDPSELVEHDWGQNAELKLVATQDEQAGVVQRDNETNVDASSQNLSLSDNSTLPESLHRTIYPESLQAQPEQNAIADETKPNLSIQPHEAHLAVDTGTEAPEIFSNSEALEFPPIILSNEHSEPDNTLETSVDAFTSFQDKPLSSGGQGVERSSDREDGMFNVLREGQYTSASEKAEIKTPDAAIKLEKTVKQDAASPTLQATKQPLDETPRPDKIIGKSDNIQESPTHWNNLEELISYGSQNLGATDLKTGTEIPSINKYVSDSWSSIEDLIDPSSNQSNSQSSSNNLDDVYTDKSYPAWSDLSSLINSLKPTGNKKASAKSSNIQSEVNHKAEEAGSDLFYLKKDFSEEAYYLPSRDQFIQLITNEIQIRSSFDLQFSLPEKGLFDNQEALINSQLRYPTSLNFNLIRDIYEKMCADPHAGDINLIVAEVAESILRSNRREDEGFSRKYYPVDMF